MAKFVQLETLDANGGIIERAVNGSFINFVHAPYETQQGKAILRMSEGAERQKSTFAVNESVADLALMFPSFVVSTVHDHFARTDYDGKDVLINPENVLTARPDGKGHIIVTFSDWTESYFHHAEDVMAALLSY